MQKGIKKMKKFLSILLTVAMLLTMKGYLCATFFFLLNDICGKTYMLLKSKIQVLAPGQEQISLNSSMPMFSVLKARMWGKADFI